jgi:hypothetical protein
MKKIALVILMAVYGFVAFGAASLQGYASTEWHNMAGCQHEMPAEPAENNEPDCCINAFGIFTVKEHQHTAARTQFSSKVIAQQRSIVPGMQVIHTNGIRPLTHAAQTPVPSPVPAYILHCVYRI